MKFRKVNIYKSENVRRLYLAPQLLNIVILPSFYSYYFSYFYTRRISSRAKKIAHVNLNKQFTVLDAGPKTGRQNREGEIKKWKRLDYFEFQTNGG